MREINKYEGFITSPSTYKCMLLSCNDFCIDEIENVCRGMDIDDTKDFYDIMRVSCEYLNSLSDFYLMLSESNMHFARRMYVADANRKVGLNIYAEYEEKYIELVKAVKKVSDSLRFTDEYSDLENAMIGFFAKVRSDFFIDKVLENKDDDLLCSYVMILPMINAASRLCSFYKKDDEDNKWPIQISETQQKYINDQIKVIMMNTINDNLNSLSVAKENNSQEKVAQK